MNKTGITTKLRCKYCAGPVSYRIVEDMSNGSSEPARRDIYFDCADSCDMSQRAGGCGHDPQKLPN